MAEEKKEKWLNYMAITTVLVAVCATLSTFKGGGYSTKSLMNQSKASDQWAVYQSKSIKGYMYEQQNATFELELAKLESQNASSNILSRYKSKIENNGKKIKKYEADKDSIKQNARGFESVSAECQRHSGSFGFAVIFLQISILLSSIAALTKKKYIWLLSVVIAAVGIFYFANGFFVFIVIG